MSKHGAQVARERAAEAKPERMWRGMVLYIDGAGTSWARVALPESVMRQHLVTIHGRGIEPPNTRGIAAAMIETELSGDAFVEGRGWPK